MKKTTYLLRTVLLTVALFFSLNVFSQTVTKQLYLSDPSQTLDQIDPVATGDATTAQSNLLSLNPLPITVKNHYFNKTNADVLTITVPNVVVGTDANRLMLVGLSVKGTDPLQQDLMTVTYGGQTFLPEAQTPADNATVLLFALVNPDPGTADVVVNFDEMSKAGVVVGVTNFAGVNQTTPLGNVVTGVNLGANLFVDVSSAPGELVYDLVAIEDTPVTADSARQTIFYNEDTTNKLVGASSIKPGAASVTMDWTNGGGKNNAMLAVAIKPAIPNTTTFTQSPVLCEALTIKVGAITVSNYVTIDSGTMPASPLITAQLKYGATNIITLTNPTYTSGLLTWTGTLGADVTVPAGQSIALTVTTAEPNASFYIDYDSQTKPSNIEFFMDSGANIFPPDIPSLISGSVSPSIGSSLIYSVVNETGLTYNWVLPVGWTQTAGGNTNSITVTVGSLTGNISVTPNNGSCDGDTRVLSLFTATKQLYLSDPSLALDRIDPVATGDTTTAQTFDPINVISNYTSNITTYSTTYVGPTNVVVGTELNRLLLVGISVKQSTALTVLYGTIPMVEVGIEITNTNAIVSIWALVNPPTGTANITTTFDRDNDKGLVVGATVFSGVDQTTPYGAFYSNYNGGSAVTEYNLDVPSAPGELVFDVIAMRQATLLSAYSGQTIIYNQDAGGEINGGGSSTRPGNSPQVTMGWNPTAGKDCAIGGISLKPGTLTTATFTQTPSFCSDFTIKAGPSNINISTYVTINTGTMPVDPSITAQLKYGATNIVTLSTPNYNSSTQLLTWTGTLGANVTIPAGQSIALEISSAEPSVTFNIDYDSQTKPSKVEFDTSTFIEITSYAAYDAPYPGGSLITNAEPGSLVYLRAVVTDPFGSYDITDLTMDVFSNTVTATSAASTSCTKTYEYEVFLPASEDPYSFVATSKEGFENTVTDDEILNLLLTPAKIDFDGIDDHIDFSDSHDLTSPFSLEAWVLQETSVANGSIISKGDSKIGNKRGYHLALINNYPNITWYDASGTEIVNLTSPYAITNNKWSHIASTFDGSIVNIYIDGIKVTEEPISIAPTDGTEKFIVGAMYDSDTPSSPKNYFNGFIDEVRIWGVSLCDDQIREMMNQEIEQNGTFVKGKIIPIDISDGLLWSSLLGYYTMEGNVADDKSDHGIYGLKKNINSTEPQTAPLPYTTGQDGTWDTSATWKYGSVWDIPNTVGVDGTIIDWNIVQLSHDMNSGDKNITVLGLVSDTANKKFIVAEPADPLDYTNSGQSLRVTHYLELDGIIDLIGKSQLLQDSGSILDADSSGYIEKDQQGTANSFNYNYWSSSVGPIGSTGARGTTSTNIDFTISGALLDGSSADDGVYPKAINFQSSYAAADSGSSDPITISTYWLWKYNGSSNNYYAWQKIYQNTPILPGEGYTMKGSSGIAPVLSNQNYVFRGKPYNGDFSLPIILGNDRLIGNPYPSAMDAEQFIKDNLSTANGGNNITGNVFNGALYFWDHFGKEDSHNLGDYVGGYATRNLIDGAPAVANDARINATGGSGTKIPGRYIPVNQGFFVRTILDEVLTGLTTINGGDIVFKNSQRVFKPEAISSSVFMRSTVSDTKSKNEDSNSNQRSNTNAVNDDNSRPLIRLQFDSPKGIHRQIVAGVDKNASNYFDLGYDAILPDLNTEDLFWSIQDTPFVIQGVDNFDYDQELPLGLIISEKGVARIAINSIENMDSTVRLFIKDSTNKTYEITKEPFEIELDQGEYYDRFSLVFQPRLKTLDEVTLEQGILVYMHDNRTVLQINRLVDTKIKSIKLFNSLGQSFNSWYSNLENRRISLPIHNVSTGMYIVQLETSDGDVIKKILVN